MVLYLSISVIQVRLKYFNLQSLKLTRDAVFKALKIVFF